MSKILKVKARQVFDSRGNPTVEAEVFSKNLSASAICPSGASTGSYEAFEKRDKKNKKYLGKSVLSAINLVNTKISKKLKGQNVHNQESIDTIMINLDGTRQKTKLGANAILAVSMAIKKLSAKIKKIPLYKTFLIKNNFKLPYPLMNIINGGSHANNGLRIQEFMIRPDRAKNFSEAMRICFLVIKNLSKIIKSKGLSTSVGDEGGFAPMISNNNLALDLIILAIKKSGFINGKDVSICLDVAANELYKKNKYSIHSKKYISANKSIQEYKKIIKKLASNLKQKNNVFVHRDFHFSNLMLTNNQIGVIDSQDALIGNRAYDLASLVDDVRLRTSESLKKKVFNFYLKKQKKIDINKFKNDFEILSILRNLKIIGIFSRLAIRDGKKNYLQLIPYAWTLINLRINKNKIFKDLKKLLKQNFLGKIK